jgi:Uma2 family endonuclease
MGLMTGHDGALPNPRGVKLTYDDFVLFPDDGLRHELIDGEHYVTPSPNAKHQRIAVKLTLRIGSWVEEHGTGELFAAPFDVLFSEIDVVEPDLIYMSKARAVEILTTANVQGVPELVIEIASPSTRRRDETIKRALYERVGVSEYWFVDPAADAILVYRRDGERFTTPHELSAEDGDVLTTPLLPGFELSIADIFRKS